MLLFIISTVSCSDSTKEKGENEKSICDYVAIQKNCLEDIINNKPLEDIHKKYKKSKEEFENLFKNSSSKNEVIEELRECIKEDAEYQKLNSLAVVLSRRQGWDYIPGILPRIKNVNDHLNAKIALIDFAVEDTSAITKIRITDPSSRSIELIRKKKIWTDGNDGCITQGMVNNILDVAFNIEFKGFVPKKSHKKYKQLMSSTQTKVEFYVKNKWYKTWYIGPPSPDYYGQVMLLSTFDHGKSAEPVMMKIKGVQGSIQPNFFTDSRQWMCTNIFRVPLEKIQDVKVIFYGDNVKSFRVTKNNSGYTVSQSGKALPYVDTANLYRYLNNFKNVNYDVPNYELTDFQCDSLKQTQPFAELILKEGTEIDNKTTRLKMYRIQSESPQRNVFGELVNQDMNKFWCELPDGSLVKCQYHVFNPILTGQAYFPALGLR